ncbi:serine/threonine protein kinase [Coleofasciculus chthonoplastes]|uniref:serine/threonine protein kinase n=1 Tax=Coleofasciculus chthonoplastes TaxID=64178 RepID=UPI0032F8892D
MKRSHQPGDIIAERYRIIAILGQGGTGTTYEAQDKKNNQRVAIKEMSLRRIKDWKDLDLFEREAQVLSYLNHPAIPNYLDYCEVDTPQTRLFYIVQELAPGRSLFDWIQSGWHTQEDEIKDIAVQILETLIYLHHISPPIIHRDIKPQNIIRREDGQVFLVDFGSVRHAYWNRRNQGMTVVGTFGYMAPEQDRGQAYPASDLYGLAATLLFLLTHRSPADLPQKRLKLDFRSRVNVSPEFADWLDKMLEPVVEDRFLSARAALNALQNPKTLIQPVIENRRRPAGSQITLTATKEQFVITIPPAGFKGTGGYLNPLAWSLLLIPITVLAVLTIAIPNSSYWLFIGLYISLMITMHKISVLDIVLRAASHIQLKINPKKFQLQWTLLGLKKTIQGRTADLKRLEIITQYRAKTKLMRKSETYIIPVRKCRLVTQMSHQRIEFAQFISQREREWVVEEVTTFLKHLHQRYPHLKPEDDYERT